MPAEHVSRLQSEEREAIDAPEAAHQLRREEPIPETPPGWSYNPSAWRQRLPILALALINCAIATYLAVCQIAFIPAWDPFFGGGTDQVLHSGISRAFPLPDAALGASAYLLEAISTVIGSTRRWHTKPWLVLVFGILVLPLCLVSMTLMILQPVVVKNWCSLCLLAAALMLLMVTLALDEVVAACQFLVQSKREGRSFWETLFEGRGSEAGRTQDVERESAPLRGLTVPWNLLVNIALGCWLLISPLVFPAWNEAAHSLYVAGTLAIAINILAMAEVARPLRLLTNFCGLWLLTFAPWSMVGATNGTRLNEVAVGAALIVFSFPRGKRRNHYGSLDRYLV